MIVDVLQPGDLQCRTRVGAVQSVLSRCESHAYRRGKEPMSYAEFLNLLATTGNAAGSTAPLSGPPSALLMSTALDAPPPPPLPRITFRGVDVLRTSAGGVVWTAAEARRARHARSPFAAPPWRVAVGRRKKAKPSHRPAMAYGVAAAEEEARQQRDKQLVSAALRMRAAAVPATMLREGDSVGNAWDEHLLHLQGDARASPGCRVHQTQRPCATNTVVLAHQLCRLFGSDLLRPFRTADAPAAPTWRQLRLAPCLPDQMHAWTACRHQRMHADVAPFMQSSARKRLWRDAKSRAHWR